MQYRNSDYNNRFQKARVLFAVLFFAALCANGQQWKSFRITPRGDTINRLDQNNQRQGPWVIRLEEVRGEPGYEEQGYFADGKKQGGWTRFSLMGDVIAREYYKYGYRDGKQYYYSRMGDLIREESWKSVNPSNPYDTIVVPDIDQPDRMIEKVIKHESAEVRHGTWVYYDGVSGAVVKTEQYVFGQVDKNGQSDKKATPLPERKDPEQKPTDPQKPATKKAIPPAIEQYQKNKKGKG